MFSKRPDKYTTGFINLRNDCFANSSLQAYSSLPSLTEYLNKFITCFKKLLEFIETHDIDVQKLIDLRLESNKFYKIPNLKDRIQLMISHYILLWLQWLKITRN